MKNSHLYKLRNLQQFQISGQLLLQNHGGRGGGGCMQGNLAGLSSISGGKINQPGYVSPEGEYQDGE